MATDNKLLTLKKGGTTQVLLFSAALKSSPSSNKWTQHEVVRFAKQITAVAEVTSKCEELESRGREEYKPRLIELCYLYQSFLVDSNFRVERGMRKFHPFDEAKMPQWTVRSG